MKVKEKVLCSNCEYYRGRNAGENKIGRCQNPSSKYYRKYIFEEKEACKRFLEKKVKKEVIKNA